MLTAGYLRKVLSYDPAIGLWRWRERADVGPNWNARYAMQDRGRPDRRHGGRVRE